MRAYLVADIEGSTGVWSYSESRSGEGWRRARVELTLDVNAAASALFDSGAEQVVVKDFHRDGFNILPKLLDRRVQLVQGYYLKPALMYGDLRGSDRAFFLGLHAGSGNPDGFLPHTLTSKIKRFEVNGKPLVETELFAGELGRFGVPVVYFSGCPAACAEVTARLPWVTTTSVPKDLTRVGDLEYRLRFARETRLRIAQDIKKAVVRTDYKVFEMNPPFEVLMEFTDRSLAERAEGWGFKREGCQVTFSSPNFNSLLMNSIKAAYFSRMQFVLLPYLLPVTRLFLKAMTAL